jgi:hypothetical protein
MYGYSRRRVRSGRSPPLQPAPVNALDARLRRASPEAMPRCARRMRKLHVCLRPVPRGIEARPQQAKAGTIGQVAGQGAQEVASSPSLLLGLSLVYGGTMCH